MLNVLKKGFRGNPNVGLYLYATDKYCLAGFEVPEEDYKEIERTLGVPVHRVSIAGTGLIGVFLAGTNEHLLVPSIAFDRELKALDKLGIKYTVIESNFTALGNNILCNDNGVFVSLDYSDEERDKIGKALGMKAKQLALGEITVIGSCAVAQSKGCIVHKAAADFEIDMIEGHLKVKAQRGTINMGSGYVKSGIVANKNGMIVGETSGGPEIVNAEEALRGEE